MKSKILQNVITKKSKNIDMDSILEAHNKKELEIAYSDSFFIFYCHCPYSVKLVEVPVHSSAEVFASPFDLNTI